MYAAHVVQWVVGGSLRLCTGCHATILPYSNTHAHVTKNKGHSEQPPPNSHSSTEGNQLYVRRATPRKKQQGHGKTKVCACKGPGHMCAEWMSSCQGTMVTCNMRRKDTKVGCMPEQ